MRKPLTSTLFPYTTLFRSCHPFPRVRREILFRVKYKSSRLRVHPRPHRFARQLQLVDERTRFGSRGDRKSTRLNSSHTVISYAVFCLKKKKQDHTYKTETP